jgi:tRNA dimethylallyltransferase
LQEVDPAAAAAIGTHNGRRLVRALEVVEITGLPFGAGLPDETKYWTPTVTVGLRAPREQLVERLNSRVGRMWAAGLVDEARELLAHGLGVTASRAIGYAQAIAELNGEISEAEAIERTAILTRKYARRQVSWFTRYPQTTWLDYDDPARVELAARLLDD